MSNKRPPHALKYRKWPNNVLKKVKEPARGTTVDDLDVEDYVWYLKQTEEYTPAGFLEYEFPIEWPFTEALEDYRDEDEPVIRFLNTIPIAVGLIKVISEEVRVISERGTNSIRKEINGTRDHDSAERAVRSHEHLSELDDELGDVLVAFESLSTHIDCEMASNVTDWVTRIRARVMDIRGVVESAFSYSIGESYDSIEVRGVIPKETYADQLLNRYDDYIDEIHSLDFEMVVDDLYSDVEKMTVDLG